MQEALRDAAETAQRKKEEKLKTGRKNKSYLEVKKDMDQKKRLKEKVSNQFDILLNKLKIVTQFMLRHDHVISIMNIGPFLEIFMYKVDFKR